MKRIAFIGLGNMGGPMAANLIKKGFELSVFDLSSEAMERLAQTGAHPAASAREAMAGCDAVVSMLPTGRHVDALYCGSEGVLTALTAGTLVIDCSTIDTATARRVASEAAALGLPMLDAPVSGGTGGATAGTLTFIVGGEREALERARPLFEAMGSNIFHAGGHGAGQMAKICNNMLLGILMAGTAEALALGVKNGLDPGVLSEIMARSSGRNWALELYNPWPAVMPGVPASRGYQGGFMSALMLKDLGLAEEAANLCEANIPMGRQATALYRAHVDDGHGPLDFSSIARRYGAP